MNKFKNFYVFVFLILMINFFSCVSLTNNSEDYIQTTYKTLKTSAIIYDTTMNTVIDLKMNDKISDEQMSEIIIYANKYVLSYQLSVECLENYKIGTTNKLTTQNQIDLFLDTLKDFINFVNDIKKDI